MFYRNLINGQIAFFNGIPNEDWVLATQNEIDAENLKQKKEEKIAQCQAYLESTDWQASAFIKYGRPLDSNVQENCLKAKELKAQIKACTTLEELNKEELNNINIYFD